MAARIRKINADTRTVYNVLARDLLAANAAISGIDAAPDGTIYASDRINHVVYKVHPDSRLAVLVGKVATPGDVDDTGVGASTGLTARLNVPYSMAVDNSVNIWIADMTAQKIKRLSPSGRCVWVAGSGVGDACGDDGRLCKFNSPYGICVDKSGILHVADTGNNKIKKMWPHGKVTSLAGGGGPPGFANGNGANARFYTPSDVVADNSGNVYVADSFTHRIRRVDPAGNVTTVAGYTIGYADGQGSIARFSRPVRLCIDPASQALYVLDSGNEAIRRVEPGGKVTTVCHYEPNSFTAYRNDITMDRSGFLYVAEG
jgi:sugar lactone lactonase YvrE